MTTSPGGEAQITFDLSDSATTFRARADAFSDAVRFSAPVEAALKIAETGHLTFGTLHTNSAAKTVDRLIDVFPGDRQAQVRTMLSESLEGVIDFAAERETKTRVSGGRK